MVYIIENSSVNACSTNIETDNRFRSLGPQYLGHHLKLMAEPWVPKDLNVMRNLEMHKTNDTYSEWPLLMMMADDRPKTNWPLLMN